MTNSINYKNSFIPFVVNFEKNKQINKLIIIYTNKCIKMYRNSLQNPKLISINTLCDIT